ncbi:MAG: acetyl-CoA C-acetyltransferase [Actinomycetota bacterium]|jgi:acetyl-CoA C-acetyltransferase|nr:acetyl-CoA C-acetyltransferase [Actinomycetota bacterium]
MTPKLTTNTVIVSSARTPIGKLAGSLSSLSATDLGGLAIAAALERAGIPAAVVDRVVMGHVLQAGQGQNPARQAAAKGGVPMDVPAVTVNSVCLSGIHAIHLAHQLIRSGEADVVVAGGMESMSQAPYLLPGARAGYRLGDVTAVDSMIRDGLWCAFDDVHMGAGTEAYAKEAGITRARQDELAAMSHQRACIATKEGRLAGEIVPVTVRQRREELVVDTDEGIRSETTVDGLGRLKPAFSPDGTITAGNASQISDGAAAVVVMSRATADELGLSPLAELVGFGLVAGPDPSLLTQPSRAIRQALERAGGRPVADVDRFEINEAFAAVSAASIDDLGIGDDVVNVNGGAIALGHPIGMSGTRLVMTLVEELRRGGGGLGAAALCGGGGQGEAALVVVGT